MATDSKTKLLRDAEKYVLQGKIGQAINEYLKIVRNDPSDILTLNTVGDLYLRQGKLADANKVFTQVAETYARNNFLLKAIAVYKKILQADSHNLDVHRVLGGLLVRQGLSVDARAQYLRIAEMCALEGRHAESLEAYEKVAELDPGHAAVHLKLADIHLAAGAKDKAQAYFSAAARAQAKSGDYRKAAASYQQASELDPLDVDALKGLVEASIKNGEVETAIQHLQHSLSAMPGQAELHEMLGRAYLAVNDPESAASCFRAAFSADESVYENFFAVSEAFLQNGDLDGAAAALDPIVTTIINRRQTSRAVEAYQKILTPAPAHVPSLLRLAEIYSAINEQEKYVAALDRLATLHLERGCPRDALEYLEKILQIAADSRVHLDLHRQAFADAFPGVAYRSPIAPPDHRRSAPLSAVSLDPGADEPGTGSLLEIDLLINYGMRQKALEYLGQLESQDPWDPEVRTRLFALHQEADDRAAAAEQKALLALISRRAGDEEQAQRHLAEAAAIAPDVVGSDFDLAAFGRKRGLVLDKGPGSGSTGEIAMEMDLSEDLTDMFFSSAGTGSVPEVPVGKPDPEAEPEAFQPELPPVQASGSLEEQIQEVDFYIRLGFSEEAKTKLDELARTYPDNADVAVRYSQLGGAVSQTAASPAGEDSPAAGLDPDVPRAPEIVEIEPIDAGQREAINAAAHEFLPAYSGRAGEALDPDAAGPRTRAVHEAAVGPPRVNDMFADIMDEVNASPAREVAREAFETHFNLGIAYREMDLLDDAIKEFQQAVRDLDASKFSGEIVQCCGMLSTCFLERGMPRSALRWCQTGLNVPEISAHQSVALRYDMGVAHTAAGDLDKALGCFSAIFASDPSYRDVASRIDQIRGDSEPHASQGLRSADTGPA